MADAVAPLEAVLRERGVADADWTTTGVTVQPAYEWRKDEHVLLGQRAVNRLQVTTRDAALVGRLLTDAVDVGRGAGRRPAVGGRAATTRPTSRPAGRPRPTPAGGPRPTPMASASPSAVRS